MKRRLASPSGPALGVIFLGAWFLFGSAQAQPHRLRPDPLKTQQELFDEGKYAFVIRALGGTAVQKLPRADRKRAYRMLGQSHERLGAIEQALSVYQLAEGLYPKDINILSELANLLHRSQLDDRALAYYHRVLAIHSNNATAHLGLAEISRTEGHLASSAEHYEKALKELSSNPLVWRDYAEVLAERQDFKKASEAIHRSLKLAYDVDSLLDLALFERRQGLTSQAYQRLSEAIHLAPGRIDLSLRHALWRLEDGHAQESLQIVEKILQNAPNNPLAYWIRASIHLRRGNRDQARRDLAIAAQPQATQPFVAQVASTMLDELKKSPY